jgi:trk system potassium uptake protein TrkH
MAAVLNVVLALTALAAAAALVLEYGGFQLTDSQLRALHWAEAVIVAVFVADRLLRFLLAENRRRFLRENWIDFALMAVAAAVIALRAQWQVTVLSAGMFYILVTQAYILARLIVHGASANLRFAGGGIHPSGLLIGSFAFLCLAGAGLLMLPAATPPGKPILFHDALFTATSACCVTGLIVRPSGTEFTFFGQAVILGLIQLGGLGIISFGTMLALRVGKTSFPQIPQTPRTSAAVGQIVPADRVGGLGKLVLFILFSTLALEGLGAVLAYPMFAAAGAEQHGAVNAVNPVWASAFHSIAAFCNAGFSVYDGNLMEGVRSGWGRPLRDHWQILGVIAPLIVLGGLGFPVLYDCAAYGRAAVLRAVGRLTVRRGRPTPGAPRLSLHSKIVLTVTVLLIFGGAGGLLLLEPPSDAARYGAIGRTPVYSDDTRHRRDWPRQTSQQHVRHAIFQSVSARTAGFSTADSAELSDAGKAWMCGLMLVGGSPAGTAGGMKTVTLVLLLITAYCVLRRRKEVEVFHRSLAAELIGKAVTLAVLYLALVSVITLLLCVAMRTGFGFLDLFFEACSACGTVGLSTGVTANLNLFGKIVIIAGMFLGRLGLLAMLLAIIPRGHAADDIHPADAIVLG